MDRWEVELRSFIISGRQILACLPVMSRPVIAVIKLPVRNIQSSLKRTARGHIFFSPTQDNTYVRPFEDLRQPGFPNPVLERSLHKDRDVAGKISINYLEEGFS